MENAITPVKDNATANPNGSSNPKGTQLPAHIQTDRGLASVNLFNPTELAAAETLMEKVVLKALMKVFLSFLEQKI